MHVLRSSFKKIVLVSTCLLLLTSCSSTKIAYNLLDTYFHWQLGKYVSLEKEQKQLAKNAFNDFHNWHRRTQLTQYANYIDSFLAKMQNEKFTGEMIHKETDELQILLDQSMQQLLPFLTDLITSFNEEQCEEFLEELADKREEYKEEYVDIEGEKVYKKRRSDLVDELGPFWGRFTDEQNVWIDEWTKALIPYEALTLEQQKISADKLDEAFEVRKDKEALKDKLKVFVFYRTDDWDPDLEAILDKNQEITYNLIAKLLNNQTDKQRQKFIKKLSGFRDDFLELAKG